MSILHAVGPAFPPRLRTFNAFLSPFQRGPPYLGVMTKYVSRASEYQLPSRSISGSHAEKLDQIDAAIQELLDIKLLECAGEDPHVRFIAARHRSHWFGMTVTILVLLAILVLLLGTRVARAQEPAAPAPAQAPAPTNDDIWSHLKFGATLEGYYEYDGNRPDDRLVPLHAYDTRSNTFGIQQTAFVVEDAPAVSKGRRFGLRVDLQFGQATETVQANPANEPRPDAYRNVWQAYGTYVFPVGKGLQVDFGKFASNLGYETNYAKDDFNFSRAYLFDFLPFYHAGLRTTLPLSDKVAVMYMLTNGIQQTEDFNNFKSNQFSAVVKPITSVVWTTSYFFGQEQPDNGRPNGPNGWLRVLDTNGTITPTAALALGFDATHVSNEALSSGPSLTLNAVGGYARYQVRGPAAIAFRYEHLDDDGLFAGIAQRLQEVTATAECKFAEGFLVRGEFRRDWSNVSFFPIHDGGTSAHQNTVLVGLVWWIGNKTGSW